MAKKLIINMLDFPYSKKTFPTREKLEFTAVTAHKPSVGYTNAKFRVAVVQEHKEVVSAVAFVKILG